MGKLSRPQFRWSLFNVAILPLLVVRLMLVGLIVLVLEPSLKLCNYLLEIIPGMRRY